VRHQPASSLATVALATGALALAVTGCVTDIDVGGGESRETADQSALEVLTPDGSGEADGDDGAGDGGAGSDCGAEICADGGDGDGDGGDDGGERPPPSRTEDCDDDIPNCNGFMGHAEPECWQDNRGGCSAEVLDAWCTRRTTGEVWDALHLEWVDERCDGDVALEENTFLCQQPGSEVLYTCTTPLVLVFDGSAVSFAADAGTASFNLAPTGSAPILRTDWPTAATPWLAFDVDGDGKITSGAELFGSATALPDGRIARQGFEALAALDDTGDGIVDAKDRAFARLLVWRDGDGDRISTAAELSTVAAEGVRGIGVAFSVRPRCDERGNCERERGAFTFVDQAGVMKRGAVVDVHLAARDAAPRVAALP